MDRPTIQEISESLRDLQGYCRTTRLSFGEEDEAGRAFDDISRQLGDIQRMVNNCADAGKLRSITTS